MLTADLTEMGHTCAEAVGKINLDDDDARLLSCKLGFSDRVRVLSALTHSQLGHSECLRGRPVQLAL